MGVVTHSPEYLAPIVTIDDCRWAISDFQSGSITRRELDSALGDAHGQRFLVERKLDKRWTWLDEHPGHEKHEERETACIETLAEYANWSDVIHDLCSALQITGDRCQ